MPVQLVELARRLDNGEITDTETESNLPKHDLVTESITAIALDTSVTDQLDKLVNIDTETESNLRENDTVTKSKISSSDSLTRLGCQPEPQEISDNDTESILPEYDNVTKSIQVSYHQTLTQSIPDLKEAIALAETIVKAKKSARESIARLLSKLYSTQVSPDDLK